MPQTIFFFKYSYKYECADLEFMCLSFRVSGAYFISSTSIAPYPLASKIMPEIVLENIGLDVLIILDH
ncbi:hypothetical protein BpHYR1_033096 [Brachionus plicatilis]|uniref:Uncharacterized protein n=1 Tax=Brachionus plicatilis TaxID=10195 RepID=A0A3M7PYZ5_BRAPC|nr:hypothetical protein BpHYR1_033096 [Brachionus plicatilis]